MGVSENWWIIFSEWMIQSWLTDLLDMDLNHINSIWKNTMKLSKKGTASKNRDESWMGGPELGLIRSMIFGRKSWELKSFEVVDLAILTVYTGLLTVYENARKRFRIESTIENELVILGRFSKWFRSYPILIGRFFADRSPTVKVRPISGAYVFENRFKLFLDQIISKKQLFLIFKLMGKKPWIP